MEYRSEKPIVKVIQHEAQRTEKRVDRREVRASDISAREFAIALESYPEIKESLIGEVEYFEIAEPSPVISQREGRHGISSRPERAPRVVRIVTADPSLDGSVAETIIKRRRIGEVVVEIIVGQQSA